MNLIAYDGQIELEDEDWEDEYDPDDDEEEDYERMCDCGYWPCGDACTRCGNPMCKKHFEVFGGVCGEHEH